MQNGGLPPIQPAQPAGPVLEPQKKSRWKFWAVSALFFVILVIVGLYFAWQWWLSPAAVQRAQLQENIALYNAAMQNYESAMRADTYGSSTPEGTLQMFIDALKQGDAELASEYFLYDPAKPKSGWADALSADKDAGNFPGIIALLERAVPTKPLMEGYFDFELRDVQGNLVADVGMKLNKYSGVWKIENM